MSRFLPTICAPQVRVDARNGDNQTAMHMAASNGHLDVMRVLQKYGASIQATDAGGDTPLHWAVCNGYPECAQFIIECGAAINECRNLDGGSPLHAAFINGRPDCARILLSAGADANARISTGTSAGRNETCLHIAAGEGSIEGVSLLLKHGAILDLRDRRGRTALHEAVRHKQMQCALTLVEAGADFSIKDDRGRSALQYVLGSASKLQELLAEHKRGRMLTNSTPKEGSCGGGGNENRYLLIGLLTN